MFTTGTEYIEYSPYSDRKKPNNRESLHFYFPGFATAIEYINYSTDSERKSPNNWVNCQKEHRNGKNCHISTGNFRKIRKIAVILHADREKLI